jgi:ADP-ribosyl-[dinitrogen reductase] hydrolase
MLVRSAPVTGDKLSLAQHVVEGTMSNSVFNAAHEGALIADALAMPVHWYYDREALKAEYGVVDKFLAPHPVHSGSILHRSAYKALNASGDILREQAQYWGKHEVHYHQFLRAGENTLNFKLAAELYRWTRARGSYDPDAWLARYIECMLQAGFHRDTYLEEYHRAFFTNYAKGKKPRNCGIEDEHIGGLATVAALVAALEGASPAELRTTVKLHVSLTHDHEGVLRAADTQVRVLSAVAGGVPLREALREHATDWLSSSKAEAWTQEADEFVVGRRLSPACYIGDAMTASLYLAWKYHDDFAGGVVANTMVGGDNCHRGAVVGSLLAAASSNWAVYAERFSRPVA